MLWLFQSLMNFEFPYNRQLSYFNPNDIVKNKFASIQI